MLATNPLSANTSQDIVNSAISAELHLTLRWQALLHIDKGIPSITDKNFLLSSHNFSLKNELIKTIQGFMLPYVNSKHAICRFPSRYLWLRHRLSLNKDIFPTGACHEFNEYKEKAPADNIKLIFASENVASSSSMMGHAFIKLAGEASSGELAEHAVSYYASIDSYNVIKVFYKSIVSGMKGLFALLPYQKLKEKYLNVEKRNIWEYELNLSELESKIMHYHIWELKGINSKYFFTTYNCATVTYFILATGRPELLRKMQKWITPTDIVKSLDKQSLIKSSLLIPSNKWNIKILLESIKPDSNLINKIKLINNKNSNLDFISKTEKSKRILMVELINSYSKHLYANNEMTVEIYTNVQDKLSQHRTSNDDKVNLDISAYKSPIKTPGDSQLSFGAGFSDNKKYISLEYLPTAHKLTDDNRQYLTENELKIGSIKIKYFPEQQDIQIDQLQLYAVTSLNARDDLTGGISGGGSIGIEQHYDNQLKNHQAFNLNGKIGLSWQLSTDILTYSLLGAGYGYSNNKHYIYTNPEIGFIINEVYDMKTIFKVMKTSNQVSSKSDYTVISLQQSLYLNKNNALMISAKNTTTENINDKSWGISYTYYY